MKEEMYRSIIKEIIDQKKKSKIWKAAAASGIVYCIAIDEDCKNVNIEELTKEIIEDIKNS